MNKKILFIIIGIIVLLAASSVIYYNYGWTGNKRFLLIKSSFKKLPGWETDNHSAALEALERSCVAINKRNPKESFKKSIPKSGKVSDWQKICLALNDVDKSDLQAAKRFFETWFVPYKVYNKFNSKGLFTGYYLPELNCSLTQDERYKYPIYSTPEDLVKVNLGLFTKSLVGRTVVGRVKGNELHLYPEKAKIDAGHVADKAKVLAWCDDKVDIAFAHIQGSAVAKISDTKKFIVNYESSNGRQYTAISLFMCKKGMLENDPSKTSMQRIRAWFKEHPDKIDYVLNQNRSYVFFRKLDIEDPLGSQQVPLIPKRSLAVDRRYIQLGTPVWLDTVIADYPAQNGKNIIPFQQLLIAQDTGGAIKGMIRGDVYWGSGDEAAFIAGHMRSKGSYWIFLPRRCQRS